MKKYKNIITLIVITLITIIGCLYALNWHSVYKQNLANSTIITNYIHEIKIDEFNNYISENPYTVIYFGMIGNENCRIFENKFKDYIQDHNLQETIVYVDLSSLNSSNFSQQFDNTYNTQALRKQNKYLNNVPAVAVYNHTTLIDFVSDTNLTTTQVSTLLSKYNFDGE